MALFLPIALIVPVACACARMRTGRYFWNIGVTGTCVLILTMAGKTAALFPMIAALLISIAGDYFMAHQKNAPRNYLLGVSGFFLAHAVFIIYAVSRPQNWPLAGACALVLAAGYIPYALRCVLPHVQDLAMRIALLSYALISCAGLALACGMTVPLPERLTYLAGMAMIVLSDTLIAEADFAGRHKLERLILPTYFACHILVTASGILQSFH